MNPSDKPTKPSAAMKPAGTTALGCPCILKGEDGTFEHNEIVAVFRKNGSTFVSCANHLKGYGGGIDGWVQEPFEAESGVEAPPTPRSHEELSVEEYIAAHAEAALPQETPAQPDWWIIHFDDAEVEPMVLQGEAIARKVFAAKLLTWNCQLFKMVDDGKRASSAPAPVPAKPSDIEREVKELRGWKDSAMVQLGKADKLRAMLPTRGYWGWDVYDATADYIEKLKSGAAFAQSPAAPSGLPNSTDAIPVCRECGQPSPWGDPCEKCRKPLGTCASRLGLHTAGHDGMVPHPEWNACEQWGPAPSGVEQRAATITHKQARDAYNKIHDALYNGKPVPCLCVPPQPTDVDMILTGYIKQQSRLASSPAAQTPEVLTQIPVRKQCSCGDPRCNYDNYWSKKHAREARSGAQTEPSPAEQREKK
jgi:hypothetical protein